MAANFAADLESPPRRPILDRYLVTSEGTDSPYRKPLSSSSHTPTSKIFASHSLCIRWIRVGSERRNTQRALILSRLANSYSETRDLHHPLDSEMSLSKGYCDLCLITKLLCMLDMQSSFVL